MKKQTTTDFQCNERVNEFTQVLRGELYFYIDSILSLGEPRNNKQLVQMNSFISEVFQMLFKWMKIFPMLLRAYNLPLQEYEPYQT